MFGKKKDNAEKIHAAIGRLDALNIPKIKDEDLEEMRKIGQACVSTIMSAIPKPPKTYERLVHDLYKLGWTVEDVKTLIYGGKID